MNGLVETEKELLAEKEDIAAQLKQLETQRDDIEKIIQEELQPQADSLKKMHDDYRVYIQIQHELSVIADFATSWETDLRELPSEEESESEYHPKELLDKEFQEKIDKLLKDSLAECSFPNLTTARLNLSSFDVEINGRKKQNFNGQGYTSFLNSIIAMSFRQYLSENAVYDPGFLVIDTPLLGLDQGISDVSPESMRASLYTYFTNHQDCGQIILLDNMKDVPNIDFKSTGTNIITFTKGLEPGRYQLTIMLLQILVLPGISFLLFRHSSYTIIDSSFVELSICFLYVEMNMSFVNSQTHTTLMLFFQSSIKHLHLVCPNQSLLLV